MNGILDTQTLRTMREAKGWDQATLAREAGVDQSVISRLERGIQGDLRASVLISLARAFQAPVDSLLATPYPYEPATLLPELARVVADLAQLEEAQQRHVAGILRAYISGLPSGEHENL
jgi:transcriptional regulator with XRE-family HTH domain